MSEPKFYTVFEADSAYLKALGDTNTYFSEFEVRLKTLEALGGKIDNSITSLLEVEKKILETVGGIATTTNDIFELRKEIAKAQGLDVSEDFNIWDVAQQEPSVGPKMFTIRFLNWDGTVLQTVKVEEGQTPVYSGTEPTKESDETYDYTFNGWLPEISPANGNVDYVAQFTATEIGPKMFTIRFLNWDGTVLETLEVEEGQTPVYGGTEPTKESDETYNYTFNGWLPEISPANGNVDYVAQFTATEIPSGPVEDPADDLTLPYVTFRAEEAGSVLKLSKKSTNQTLEYSKDKSTWTALNWSQYGATSVVLSNVGEEVYVRGKLTADNTTSNYTSFTMTGKTAAYGNINALWDYEDLNAPLKTYCGYNLFAGCASLTKAPKLPATTLTVGCYGYMFANCSTLTKAPELPATTLTDYCYTNMFYGCSSLTQAPELPATTLTAGCYTSMFSKCSSLTQAPELPATTLANQCYFGMFSSCTSLIETPELPAAYATTKCYMWMFSSCTSLIKANKINLSGRSATDCCVSMFNGCTSLTEVICLATSNVGTNYAYFNNWLNNVAPTGVLYKMAGYTWHTVIPSGWTQVDYAG